MPIDIANEPGEAPAPFDAKVLRTKLDAMRSKYGADSAIGLACSTIITQLNHHPITEGVYRENLEQRMMAQVKRLAELRASVNRNVKAV